jgi:N-acetylmuramoyl-L-alanine amidase
LRLETSSSGVDVTMNGDSPVVRFVFGSPLFWWDADLLQLVDVPFMAGGTSHVPLQFILDFLPARMEQTFTYSPDDGVLEILDPALWSRIAGESGRTGESRTAGRGSSIEDSGAEELVEPTPLSEPVAVPAAAAAEISTIGPEAERRVVVIDPGHGGKDRGTTGPGGRREKDIALAVARQLARELRADEGLEVYMTRDRDEFVPLWERGEQATLWKGERPGVFISIHANYSTRDASIRGFETYFLSEARTEHERRVAANENAPLLLDDPSGDGSSQDADLTSILRELRSLDHQHWSSLLAEGIQVELEAVHPGPNRGVKQGPFAVITNALMPAVLVELGFVSNREEERVLSQGEFQSDVARALANAIRQFYQRYPPGQAGLLPGPRR